MPVRIIIEQPPNITTLRAAFRLTGGEVFAWAGVIYNPGGGDVSRAFIEHERVHFKQQREAGGPEAWWDRYIVDPAWRLEQEMEATAMEFKVYSEDHGRAQRRCYLDCLARRLSLPMYGRMISKKDAKVRLKALADVTEPGSTDVH